jgi:hypothetical protein
MVGKISRMVWLVAGLFLLFACDGFAQSTTGMILASVYDSSGASVAGVTLTITNVDQNVAVRTVTTDESGQFVAPQTGLPLTPVLGNGACSRIGGTGRCVDPTGSGCLLAASPVGCRPHQVGDPNSSPAQTYGAWFNAGAFAAPDPTLTALANSRPGSVRGPGFWRTDLSLFKNMKFNERLTGQLRWETFNTFNHANPICCASLNVTSSFFNQVTSTRDPRIMQLGMKLNF